MSPPAIDGQRALAILREPSADEASRWYKPRTNPPLARMKFLVDFLLDDPLVRLVKRSEACVEMVFDAAPGAPVRLTIRPEDYELRAGPVLVKPPPVDAEPAPPRHSNKDLVADVVEVLQLASGYYVYSDTLIGFEASGGCPGCALEVFEWQDQCDVCGAKLHPPSPGEDEHDGRSKRVVEALLRRKMIELCSPRGRRSVERTVAAFYGYGTAGPDVLLAIFMDMADIAEVYCDEDELFQVLLRVR